MGGAPWLGPARWGAQGALDAPVKALNRRIAGELNIEYDTLRPVADLVARLTESVSRFLDHPAEWTRPPEDEGGEQDAISAVRRRVFAALHGSAEDRLIAQQLAEWRRAYDYAGRGSTYLRARDIRAIYEAAAPVPGAVMPPPAAEFLREVRRLVHEAIEQAETARSQPRRRHDRRAGCVAQRQLKRIGVGGSDRLTLNGCGGIWCTPP